MAKKASARILGPYKEREDRWRLIEVDCNGTRIARYFTSRRDAERAKGSSTRQLKGSEMLVDLVELFLAARIESGRLGTTSTTKSMSSALCSMFAERRVQDVTGRRAADLVESWRESWAVATQKLRLAQAHAFWHWLVEQGYAPANPFDGLKVRGRVNVGKPQLRIDEARRFTQAAMARFESGYRFALAPLLGLLMGMRASEICNRVVRDVDDEGAIIWIDSGKTANARRHLKVPRRLRPMLAIIVQGRDSSEPLWGRGLNGPQRYCRQDLHKLVHLLCDEAGVPRVCPHSLRGLWASLAVESGSASEAVAAALGHGSFDMTAKHYAKPESIHSANCDRADAALFRDPSAKPN